jgi:N-methylhydantoinase A
VFLGGDDLTADAIAELVDELGSQAREELHEPEAELHATYELRYRGQAFELAVAGERHADPAELRVAFEAIHEERYGYHDPEQELELVTLRVSATLSGAEVSLSEAQAPTAPERGEREATLDGQRVTVATLRGPIAAGTAIEGPCVVELPESTLLVAPGWTGEVDDTGTIHIRR